MADKQKGGAPLDRVPLRRRHYHRRRLELDRVALGPTHPSAITPSLGLPHRELLPPVCIFAICLCLACPRLTPAGAGMHPLTEPADSRVLPPPASLRLRKRRSAALNTKYAERCAMYQLLEQWRVLTRCAKSHCVGAVALPQRLSESCDTVR